MSSTIVFVLSVVVVLIIVALLVALGLYWVGFRVKETEVNTGLVKAKLERSPTDSKPTDTLAKPHPETEIEQKATAGGQISKSPIEAPADSGAKVSQTSSGDDSKISNSGIKLT